jgi:hypothetical protein
VLFAIVGLSCDGGGAMGPTPPDSGAVSRIAPRLGVMALAIAAASQGASFFDNALPCVRRGVVTYRNTPLGRAVTFHGCDLGEGIVVSGSGELRWAGSGLAAERGEFFCGSGGCPAALAWSGDLRFDVQGADVVELNEFRIENLTLGADGGLFPEEFVDELSSGPGFVSMTVAIAGAELLVDDRALPSELFDTSGLTLVSLPNPSGSLSALTEVDMRRLALASFMDLAAFLTDETIDPRGSHEHELPCGVFRVEPGGQGLPVIEADLSACDLAGVVYDGVFRFQWEEFGIDGGTMIMEGSWELGGGVPNVEVERVRWTVEILGPPLETIRVRGELQGSADSRTFDFTLLVDD